MNDRPSESQGADLFGRLIDDSSRNQKEAVRHSPSSADLLRSVRRNILWLLNTKTNDSNDPIHDYPYASKSVLNFGVKDFEGVLEGHVGLGELQKEIERVIRVYEPRIRPQTLSVTASRSTLASELTRLNVEISGTVRFGGLEERLFFIPKMDLESGHFNL